MDGGVAAIHLVVTELEGGPERGTEADAALAREARRGLARRPMQAQWNLFLETARAPIPSLGAIEISVLYWRGAAVAWPARRPEAGGRLPTIPCRGEMYKGDICT